MSVSAILFIIFNRPSCTQQVFEQIARFRPSKLFIAADAPRNNNQQDLENCKNARAVTENIDWPCEVKRLYQGKNLGCSFGPRAAFDWFFSHEEEGIILEDDCVPHQDFFSFATCMLDRFRDNKKIISINGSNLGYELIGNKSYSFSRYMNMWGWATWADRAKAIDYSLEDWKQVKNPMQYLHLKLRNHFLDYDTNWYRYWIHKFNLTTTTENMSWWDWQWVWHQIKNDQFSVVPSVNLVKNIGFSEEATHTKISSNPSADIKTNSLNLPLIHPRKIKNNLRYEQERVKKIWCLYNDPGNVSKLVQKIKSLLR